jgi:hypothetical protein
MDSVKLYSKVNPKSGLQAVTVKPSTFRLRFGATGIYPSYPVCFFGVDCINLCSSIDDNWLCSFQIPEELYTGSVQHHAKTGHCRHCGDDGQHKNIVVDAH